MHRRTLGSALDQKNAAITAELRAMVDTLSPSTPIGVRDRALLLVGFAGAFRRSELVSLDVADVAFAADGLIVQLRRSKTDQEGEGERSVCRSGRIRSLARSALYAPGLTSPSSPAGRSSARSIATATSRTAG